MKDKELFGMESLIIWNAALILTFVLIISLGSIGHLFNPAVSGLSKNIPAQLH